MATTVEFLIPRNLSRTGGPIMEGLYKVALQEGFACERTETYLGRCNWLVLYGVGHSERAPARAAHVKSGRRVIMWDMGYFGRKKVEGYCRFSIDHDHPQAWLDKTPTDPSRWNVHGIPLRESFDPKGHIILAGLGYKSRLYLGLQDWELHKLAELRERFPKRKIIYRPKPGRVSLKRVTPVLDCVTDAEASIEKLLSGASLVVCRHSNVAVDAIIAGVPFECEDGAAKWLLDKPFTVENRTTFLHKLAWWQWNKYEAKQAWQFIQRTLQEAS